MTWLLPFALLCLVLGPAIQIVEEWRQRGLTDTSYLALSCSALGGVLMWPVILALPIEDCAIRTVALLVAGASAVAAVAGFYLKARPGVRTVLAALRRR